MITKPHIESGVANKVAKTMPDEENLDMNAIKDLTSEIMNTIGGKIKTVISDAGIPISISLPNAFTSKAELKNKLGNQEGIGIELSLDNDSFHLFLIGSILNRVL